MDIRLAGMGDLPAVLEFYEELIDAQTGAKDSPRWTKGVYPSEEDLRKHIAGERMFLGFRAGELSAAMALTRNDLEGYDAVPWRVEAAPEEVFFLHLLAVHPRHARRGLGREMVSFAMEQARSRGAKALRLDVIRENRPAVELYTSMGFQTAEESRLYYEDIGWADFWLMEYAL